MIFIMPTELYIFFKEKAYPYCRVFLTKECEKVVGGGLFCFTFKEKEKEQDEVSFFGCEPNL